MDSFEAPPSVKAFNFFSNLVAHDDDEDDMILGWQWRKRKVVGYNEGFLECMVLAVEWYGMSVVT